MKDAIGALAIAGGHPQFHALDYAQPVQLDILVGQKAAYSCRFERCKGDVSLGPMPVGRDRNQLIDALADMPLSGYHDARPNARRAAKAET